MTIDEFETEAIAHVKSFLAKWREEHAKTPDLWPNEMEPGEWWEQLIAADIEEGDR